MQLLSLHDFIISIFLSDFSFLNQNILLQSAVVSRPIPSLSGLVTDSLSGSTVKIEKNEGKKILWFFCVILVS